MINKMKFQCESKICKCKVLKLRDLGYVVQYGISIDDWI